MSDLGDAVGAWINGMIILIFISVPLGLWKLIDIVIWLFSHVEIGIK
jgi:hypothetical protein